MRFTSFNALRPPDPLACEVAAVPYDTVDAEEARAIVSGNPKSFLRIDLPEVDLPAGTDSHSPAVYAKAGETFRHFRDQGWFVPDPESSFYVYRLQMGTHVQSGIVGCCHIEDYEADRIRKHEKTRADKEEDRVKHIRTLGAHTGPILMTHEDDPAIASMAAQAEEGAPLVDFTAADGIRHTVWRMQEPAKVGRAFSKVGAAYIADGHHRAAAAVRIGAERRAANPVHTGRESYNWFLAVLFPAGRLQVLPYNRCVRDLAGRTPGAFLDQVRGIFRVRETAAQKPSAARAVCMYLEGRWYELAWEAATEKDPVAGLDVSVLQDRLLAPVLGITDPRKDARIEFVGGIRGTEELVKRVDSGRSAVAFSMFPVSVHQMMAIADAGGIMPPKSTWFEPKLRSGLFVHPL